MTFKKLIAFVCILIVAVEANAQFKLISRNKVKVSEASIYGSFGLYDQPSWGVGSSLQYLWGVGRGKQRFKLGAGIRANSMFSKRRQYETSKAEFIEYLLNGTDSVYFDKMNFNMLNVYFAMMYNVKRGIDFGVNLDIGGITFGGTQSGMFHSYELTQGTLIPVNVAPFAFNLNKGMGRGNVGNIYTEAFFQFRISQVTRFRLGASYIVSEVKTTKPITANGNRFRSPNFLATAGIVFNVRDGESEQHFR